MTVANIPDQQKLWESCLNYMSLRVKKHSFNTWFKYTRGIYDSDASSIVINVPNQFVADWLSDRYADLISEAIRETSGKSIDFLFEISHPSEFEPQTEIDFNPKPPEPAEIPAHARLDYPLNERFRFDNFVVGKFNQFGHAAAVAVAEAPGTTPYNPLFIYGGTGLGKTHLIQAIGHYVQEQFPRKKIVYATSEKFTSDFIYAVSNGKINDFTSLYRSADILLVDDVQFFSGKESTQEQFFHTFNDLSHSGKQVVLTSDRHPRDIKGLEERLLSRFSSGLVADLQPPDLESRIAILRKRTDHEKVVIPEDVLYFIADNVNSNVRELEGCLTKLLAYASLEKTDIDRQFAERALGKEIIRPRREISITEIQKKSAEFFQIDAAMMTAKKKTSRIALARQVAMYLSRKLTAFSLKSIGEAFGGRDHSTVIHACDSIAKKMENDYDFREKVTSLEAALLC